MNAKAMRKQTVTQRAEQDALLAVEEAIRTLDAAGLPITGDLIEAYIVDIALPRLQRDFTRDYLNGWVESDPHNSQPHDEEEVQ
jgi:hypothetical protein